MKTIIHQILSLLSKREKRSFVFLIVLIFLMALLQMVGVGSIMPFMTLVTDTTAIESNEILSWLYTRLQFQDARTFLIYMCIGVIALLVVSNGYSVVATYFQMRFVSMRNYSISKRLLRRYLERPYAFYLERNSSELSKNILAEVQRVITWVFMPLTEILSKSLSTILMLAMLLVVDPLATAFLGLLLSGCYFLIYKLMQRRITNYGKERVRTNEFRYKTTSEAFLGIKEIKLSGREDLFIDRFAGPAKRYAEVEVHSKVISRLPKFVLETIAFSAILLIILYYMLSSREMESIIPIVSLYAFAGYRLLPALQKIFSGFAQIRFQAATLQILFDDYTQQLSDIVDKKDSAIPRLRLEKNIRLEDISFSYSENINALFDKVNLSIDVNSTIGFVGETGSGKTSLVDIILGLLEPNSGHITIDDIRLDRNNTRSWQSNIGYVPQEIFLIDNSIAENIAFGLNPADINDEQIYTAGKIANLHAFVEKELPKGYDTIVGDRGIRLSGGQRQRIGIARALYNDPDVIVFDEATSALDTVTEEAIMDSINRISKIKTIILIAHRLSTVKNCDKIFFLEGGRILGSGTYDELIAEQDKFRKMVNDK
jgi:ATP-binding cassette, subfamily B, bacterial PglK